MTLNVKPKPLKYNRILKNKITALSRNFATKEQTIVLHFPAKVQKAFICQPFLLLREELPFQENKMSGFGEKLDKNIASTTAVLELVKQDAAVYFYDLQNTHSKKSTYIANHVFFIKIKNWYAKMVQQRQH